MERLPETEDSHGHLPTVNTSKIIDNSITSNLGKMQLRSKFRNNSNTIATASKTVSTLSELKITNSNARNSKKVRFAQNIAHYGVLSYRQELARRLLHST